MAGLIKKFLDRYYQLRIITTSDPYLVAGFWRRRGFQIGEGTCIYRNVILDVGNGKIIIGKNCVLTGCMVLTHDASTNRQLGIKYGMPSIRKNVVIEDECFIGVGAIILMGVTVGRESIIGAGAVVTKDVPPGCIVAGNPARVVGTTQSLVAKRAKDVTNKMPQE